MVSFILARVVGYSSLRSGIPSECPPKSLLTSCLVFSGSNPSFLFQKKYHHLLMVAFLLARAVGFEPTYCQSQSLMPYRLATPEYLYHNNKTHFLFQYSLKNIVTFLTKSQIFYLLCLF